VRKELNERRRGVKLRDRKLQIFNKGDVGAQHSKCLIFPLTFFNKMLHFQP